MGHLFLWKGVFMQKAIAFYIYVIFGICIFANTCSYGMLAVPPQNRTIGRGIVLIGSAFCFALTAAFSGVCSILNWGSIISETSGTQTPFAGCGSGSMISTLVYCTMCGVSVMGLKKVYQDRIDFC